MWFKDGYGAFALAADGSRGWAWNVSLEEARANLEEAVTMVLDANRELSEQSLKGAEVIREVLILPAA